MRTGILGGTFDPVHRGHLDVARATGNALRLDRVLFMPARVPPHRAEAPKVSAYHRVAMLALATASAEGFLISDLELCTSTAAPSYTSVTLERLAHMGHPRSELFFILGADAFADIASWHDYPAVLDRSHFAVVSRPGHPVRALTASLPDVAPRMQVVDPDMPIPTPAGGTTVFLVDAETFDVSSTQIRRRLAGGEPISGLVPEEVESYIARHGLYAARAGGEDPA